MHSSRRGRNPAVVRENANVSGLYRQTTVISRMTLEGQVTTCGHGAIGHAAATKFSLSGSHAIGTAFPAWFIGIGSTRAVSSTMQADIVTEVRREAALLKTGALQNAIFNSANFSSIATDEKGVIQLFNVGAERMLGYTAAEVVDKITPADISDPQEVIARAKALSHGTRHPHHAGVRGAGLQGLARHRRHL